MSSASEHTIQDLLARFLADQRVRLAPRTYRNYEYVVELLSHCLNAYAYQGLNELDRKRWEKASLFSCCCTDLDSACPVGRPETPSPSALGGLDRGEQRRNPHQLVVARPEPSTTGGSALAVRGAS